MKSMSIAIFIFSLSAPLFATAWGVRGHESICEAAAKLVHHPILAEFLIQKSARIGYLCDVPDLQWRLMSQNYREHRLNPEEIGSTLAELSLDYNELMAAHPGQSKVLGSNWWRADQFYRRSIQEDSKKNPVEFLENLGYMGHFIGDVSQPLHSTADYDGYNTGHGGIHFYYEESVVHYIDGTLSQKIVETAQNKLLSGTRNRLGFLNEVPVLEKIRSLALLSQPDREKILRLDPISKLSSHERGLSLPAERNSAKSAVQDYEPMILDEMANAALLLAQLWDLAYEKIGEPNLNATPVQLPLVFKYIKPDYLN
jgi:hypothetical protein